MKTYTIKPLQWEQIGGIKASAHSVFMVWLNCDGLWSMSYVWLDGRTHYEQFETEEAAIQSANPTPLSSAKSQQPMNAEQSTEHA